MIMYRGPQLGAPQEGHPDYKHPDCEGIELVFEETENEDNPDYVDPSFVISELDNVEVETFLTEADLIMMSDEEIRAIDRRSNAEIATAESHISTIRELSPVARERVFASVRAEEVIQEMKIACIRLGIRLKSLLLFRNGDPVIPPSADLQFIAADILCTHIRTHFEKEALITELRAA